jgi:hypothetical protein
MGVWDLRPKYHGHLTSLRAKGMNLNEHCNYCAILDLAHLDHVAHLDLVRL